MNLYLLTQFVNKGYDTYRGCIVAADSEEDARCINPDALYIWKDNKWRFKTDYDDFKNFEYCWVDIKDIKVTYIGIASDDVEANSVVLSSFRAG